MYKSWRDKFLTETIGERNMWADDFSTWEGFGKLWEWAKGQEWWKRFYVDTFCFGYSTLFEEFIHPNKFADAIYKFLKERGDSRL